MERSVRTLRQLPQILVQVVAHLLQIAAPSAFPLSLLSPTPLGAFG